MVLFILMIITQAFTPNKDGRSGKTPEIIVIHIGEGSKQAILSEFANPKTEKSTHYLVCRDGSKIQFVDESLRAWGNGIVWKPQSTIVRDNYLKGVSINAISISIECEGWSYQDPTEAYYKSVVELVKDISRRYNIPIDEQHIIPHRWIRADKTCPGRISVGKIISMCNEPIKTPISAPTIPAFTTANIEVNPPLVSIPAWMENLIYRTKVKLGFADDKTFGAKRSSGWPRFRREFLKGKSCAVCGGTEKIELHHIEPFHLKPEFELDFSNVIPLCESKKWGVTCHQFFGHLGDYKDANSNVVYRSLVFLLKMTRSVRPLPLSSTL